ncbi:hypothetical protein GQ457_05G017110 [Hibiscus cannabinus]
MIYGDEIEMVRRLLHELLLEYQDIIGNDDCAFSTSSSHDGLLDKRNAVNTSNENDFFFLLCSQNFTDKSGIFWLLVPLDLLLMYISCNSHE